MHEQVATQSKIHISLGAETLGHFLGIPITNALIMSLLGTVVLITIAFLLRKRSLIPGRLQALLEMAVGGVYEYVETTLEDREAARQYFPLILTIFFAVLIGNLIHFIPGVDSILYHTKEGETVPLLRAAATDLNVTLALALIAFISIELSGFKALGFSYLRKFVNLHSFLGFAVGIIDLFSELARLISFSFRLFGNIFAGGVVVLIIVTFIPVIAPVPMLGFEVFVGFIQAAIFALLTLFFIKAARTPHH
jgi:F-type H+-transporting ATPase subunit a